MWLSSDFSHFNSIRISDSENTKICKILPGLHQIKVYPDKTCKFNHNEIKYIINPIHCLHKNQRTLTTHLLTWQSNNRMQLVCFLCDQQYWLQISIHLKSTILKGLHPITHEEDHGNISKIATNFIALFKVYDINKLSMQSGYMSKETTLS